MKVSKYFQFLINSKRNPKTEIIKKKLNSNCIIDSTVNFMSPEYPNKRTRKYPATSHAFKS